MAYFNTDKDRRNYLIYKLLGMTSLQFMGVGWCHKSFMNLSVFYSHCLQTTVGHILQPPKIEYWLSFPNSQKTVMHQCLMFLMNVPCWHLQLLVQMKIQPKMVSRLVQVFNHSYFHRHFSGFPHSLYCHLQVICSLNKFKSPRSVVGDPFPRPVAAWA